MTTKTSESAQAHQQWQSPPQGSPCWIEIPARDTERLKKFYATVFPSWEWRRASEEASESVHHYRFADQKGLGGGIVKMPEACGAPVEQAMGSGMTVYYMVDSLNIIEKIIHDNGGSTCLGKTDESSFGWFMNFRDPEGNRFGCYQIQEQ
ncbi:VOC family protein [Aspergillus lucknowensis]|uniref:Glyoxalase-like domain-containing protein n=1 Tax=Aspergillus lucknowensis TaxID=176173 RepID=A0ABR4LJV0_9EURO